VFVLNASMGGFRIAHQEKLTSPCTIEIESQTGPIRAQCEITRQNVHRYPASALEKPTYHSGLSIQRIEKMYEEALRALIAYYVERALDEQRANARGIPATAAASFQTGKGTNFLRCDFLGGRWIKTPTTKPDQPPDGFTISAEEDEEAVERLCNAYAKADAAGRKLMRTLAAMSISKAEGIPTRRYTP
jgi:hypothetical protein